jgi:hypothetical protein
MLIVGILQYIANTVAGFGEKSPPPIQLLHVRGFFNPAELKAVSTKLSYVISRHCGQEYISLH